MLYLGHQMRMLIGDIAFLFSGIYVNTSSARGEAVYYLQVRHWDKQRKWSANVEPELRTEARFYKNFLMTGDLLLVTKGTEYFAALYDGRYGPAIASSVFTVLRIRDTNTLLPTYLQWCLNHPVTAKKLAAGAKGTSIPLITRDVVEQLEIPVPTLIKQATILQVQQLHQAATSLRSRINRLNETIFYSNLLQSANQ